jgi:hypothetical protein
VHPLSSVATSRCVRTACRIHARTGRERAHIARAGCGDTYPLRSPFHSSPCRLIFGKGFGTNWCNSCSCMENKDGTTGLMCTEMGCVGTDPEAEEKGTCVYGADTVEVGWKGKGAPPIICCHFTLCPCSLPQARTHWACARTHRSCWLRRHLPPPLPVSFIPVSADLRQRVWHQLVQLLLVHGEQ